jgi:hypothetical protein
MSLRPLACALAVAIAPPSRPAGSAVGCWSTASPTRRPQPGAAVEDAAQEARREARREGLRPARGDDGASRRPFVLNVAVCRREFNRPASPPQWPRGCSSRLHAAATRSRRFAGEGGGARAGRGRAQTRGGATGRSGPAASGRCSSTRRRRGAQTATTKADGSFRFGERPGRGQPPRVEAPAFATLERRPCRRRARASLTLVLGQVLRGTVTLADRKTPGRARSCASRAARRRRAVARVDAASDDLRRASPGLSRTAATAAAARRCSSRARASRPHSARADGDARRRVADAESARSPPASGSWPAPTAPCSWRARGPTAATRSGA